MSKFVISVLIADRVGILRQIASALTGLGADITGISQTVVQGYFTVIVVAAFREKTDCRTVYDAIMKRFTGSEASVIVRDFEARRQRRAGGSRYILTMVGKEQPGILKAVTAFLAEKRVNIEDLFFTIQGDRVTHVGELSVPASLDIKQFQQELQSLLAPMDLKAMLQHENIFRAMNEVDAVSSLLRKEKDAQD